MKAQHSSLPLLQQTAEVLVQYLHENQSGDQKISQYYSASELSERLALSLPEEGCDDAQILAHIQQFLEYSVRTAHPHFMKQLFGGNTPAAIAGDWVTTVTNTAAHTYQVSPVATLMEQQLIEQLGQLVGFKDADGIMVTGGSNANLLGLLCGLHTRWPEAKQQGMFGIQPVLYVSDQCHYSYEKAVFTLGIGTDNMRKVASNDRFEMCPKALREQITQDIAGGKQPFLIGATAGTTVAGAFDPIDALADLAAEFGLWLHVDAAWGGPVRFSDTHKDLMKGVERADSVTWDAHKFMAAPLICSAILLREKGILESACRGGGSAYLFHPDENADYNFGQKSLQCGRRVDSLKLWLDWRSKGSSGYREILNNAMQLAQHCCEWIKAHPRLTLLLEPDYLNVFFRYVPDQTQGSVLAEDEAAIKQLNLSILDQMKQDGSFYVDYATLNEQFGIRLVIANNQLQASHLNHLFEEIVRLGDQLSATVVSE